MKLTTANGYNYHVFIDGQVPSKRIRKSIINCLTICLKEENKFKPKLSTGLIIQTVRTMQL